MPVTAGYRDFWYGNSLANDEPTGEKPQSKLWWNDGFWWGSLWNEAERQYEIHRFDPITQSWITTSTPSDDRTNSKADALWDGQHLYIVSNIYTASPAPAPASNAGRLYRYSYNALSKTYTLNSGYPVLVNSSKSEALVLDKDSTGQLWVTWVENGKVKVNRTTGDDRTWGTPFDLPVQGNDVRQDDISSVLAFGGNKIGIMWSNQNDYAGYFAVHLDGDADQVWQSREEALFEAGVDDLIDDHINIKPACDGSGNIYAAVKTGLQGNDSPRVVVLKRTPAAVWTSYVFGTKDNYHTRPILLIDQENQKMYVFARSTNTGPGILYMKSTNLGNINFPTGMGTPFIESDTDRDINNPTSTKQCINSATGVLVLASDSKSRYYLHNYINLGGATPPTISSFTPTMGPLGTEVTVAGNNLGGATSVTFNGIAAAGFTVVNSAQIRATVPAGATTGKIRVTTGNGTGVSFSDFTVSLAFSFTPLHDAYVRFSSPDQNYGSAISLLQRVTDSEIIHSYLKFNVAGVKWPIYGAKLRLHVTNASNDGGVVYAVSNHYAGSAAAWDESGLNWNNAPVIAGSALSTAGAVSVGNWIEFDVTAAILGDGIYSFGLKNNSSDVVYYSAKEGDDPPALIVYTGMNPQPSPTITSFSPTSGEFGTEVTINGTQLGGATQVKFNGTGAGNFTADSPTQIHATVPTGATTGKISVTSASGSGQSANNFTVTSASQQYTLAVSVTGSGNVILNPSGGVYNAGTVVTLTATAAAGFQFSGWSGSLSGSANPTTIAMNANKNVMATFTATPLQYTLTLNTVGAGTVTLSPPGGIYSAGAEVTLTANAETGSQFSNWSGDLNGSGNPATITMNANKSVTVTFIEGGAGGGETIVHKETKTGGSTSSATITTSGPLTGESGQLYLAAIATKPNVAVSGVSGLGLNWTLVKAQCAGRSQTAVEVWMAQGTPSGNGLVTATLTSNADNAAIAVSRYAGVAASNPLGNLISGNTNGINGTCSGGADNSAYSFNLTTASGTFVYGAAAMRYQTHTPGTGYTEYAEVMQGSGGSAASVAVQGRSVDAASIVAVNGSFDGSTDWAVVAVEIKPQLSLMNPSIASFAPTYGPVGTEVTITGSAFTNITDVAFNGVAALSFTVDSATRLRTVVPTGATTGKISVTNASGSTLSAADFTVTVAITFTPLHDAYVRLSSPAQNYSATLALLQKTTDTERLYTFLKFHLTGISGPVMSATLRLYVTDASDDGGAVFSVSNNYRGTAEAWLETGLNWDNAPTISGAPLSAAASVEVGKWVELDVTAAISGDGTHSFGLKSASANVVNYSSKEGLHAPELIIQIDASAVPAPTITSFTPASGYEGDEVTISGANFEGVTQVAFNGTAATDFVVDSPAQIHVNVPVGATTGPISISTPAGTIASGANFTVTLPPTFTFTPLHDAYIRLSSPEQSYSATSALLQRVSGSETIRTYLKFNVTGLSGAVTNAKLRLYVTNPSDDGGAVYLVSNNYEGTITAWTEDGLNWNNAPAIATTVLSAAGPVGSDQWIELNVTAAISGNGVYSFVLKNASADVVNYSSKEGGNSPELVIQEGFGVFSGPAITSFNPASGFAGTEITFSGINFTGAIGVAFNGVAATNFMLDSPTQIRANVPAGASTGKLSVTTVEGTALSASEFTVAATPSTFTFTPLHDAYVRLSSPQQSYSATPALLQKVSGSETIYTYLKFQVAALSGTVTRATLRLYVTDASDDGGALYVVSNNFKGTTTEWTETDLNWSNAPVIGATSISAAGPVNVDNWIELDVTSAITDNGTYSFGLKNTSSNVVNYSSKEGGNPPKLIIQTGSSAKAAQTMALDEPVLVLPERLSLLPSYPNPFNARTAIEYALPEEANIRLVIFNSFGQVVRKLVGGIESAGYKRIVWDGTNDAGVTVSSGVYFYQLETDFQTLTGKMILQR